MLFTIHINLTYIVSDIIYCCGFQEPYNMPGGFSWSTMDVTDAAQLDEIYTLLYENYVEDDDEMFR